MAQAAGISFVNNYLEYSTTGSAGWTDISGYSNSVQISGGERAVAELNTFGTKTPIVVGGNRAALTIKVKAVYTEGVSDLQEIIRAAYENHSNLFLRWAPSGSATGKYLYTSGSGTVTSHPYPGGEAGAADVLMTELTLVTPTITRTVI